MGKESKIFVGYRALGFVSNDIPLSLRYIMKRKENLVVTVVGKCFHTYGCGRLNLLSVSTPLPDDISCLTSDPFLVYTACKNTVFAWRRGTELKHVYKCPAKDVHLMLPFGAHLLVIDEDSTLFVWDINNEVIDAEVPFSNADFCISAIAHPSTYLNKILLGSKQGSLRLWNLKTNKLIYTFEGWNSSVTVIEQAPALDVVAIGLASGEICIHNLKYDETILKFFQDWGPVTAVSFRTDGLPLMTSASTVGHIAVWNLEKKRLHSEIRNAHKSSVTGMKFLPNEPLLVTSSPDNTLKMWIFDMPDSGGRLHKLREGHSNPPMKIRFYGTDGSNILSAGLDSTLRSFSTIVDSMNKNLGQASYNRKLAKKKGIRNDTGKLPPIVDFTSEIAKEKEWDNIVAIHRDFDLATTWTYDSCRMGEHKLLHERFRSMKNVSPQCVTLTACGNFVLIGYNTGHLDKFNAQSGLYRGSYGKETAHDSTVRSVVSDGLNQIVVSGGGDNLLKFWNFKSHLEIASIEMQHSISSMIIHRESAMIAVALDNFSIVIVDQESKRVVRIFDDHSGRISDMTFSSDSRWLIVATVDALIKTWDLPTGRLIDCFQVASICVSLTMSPTGEYLATAHAGDLGIYIWSNATLYTSVALHPLPEDYEPALLELPSISLEGKNSTAEAEEEEEEDSMDVDSDEPEFKSPEQIADELVTLSTLPQSHWLNLLDLDTIKLRNKPKEPAKAPKNAPFFLPVKAGLKPTFFIEQEEDWRKKSEKKQVFEVMQRGSEFFSAILDSDQTQNYASVVETLKTYNPSKIDVEIRCLSPENGGSVELMQGFLKAMCESLKTNRNFELIYSYIALFLQIHCDTIACKQSLRSCLEELQQVKTWDNIQEKINVCLCIGNYVRSVVI